MRANYLVRRVAFAAITTVIAITLNFVLFRAIPGNATTALRCEQCSPEVKKELAKNLGLDRALPIQFGYYVGDLAHGDLGSSLTSHLAVTHEIAHPLLNTLPMVGLGLLFAIVLGVFTGVVAAWRRGGVTDRAGLFTSLAFYSMPSQWLGLIMVFFVAPALRLPTAGVKSIPLGILHPASEWTIIVDRLQHMTLPALTLGLVLYGQYAIVVRSAMLETLGDDYVLTARAKGLSPWRTLWQHAFPNARLPLITLIALSVGYIVGGVVVIETVFSYPGIGLAVLDAINRRDYPVLQGAFLVLTCAVIAANLIADLLYGRLDPRVRS